MTIRQVSAGTPGGIQGAVSESAPGDVIVVRCGVYHESVTVTAAQNNFRIVAEHNHCAILDGANNPAMPNAFILDGTTGVEIEGFKISNYLNDGIVVTGTGTGQGFNRIVENRIEDVGSNGIEIANESNGNLVWRNHVKRTLNNGVVLDSTDNRVIENTIHHNSFNGVSIGGTGSDNNVVTENHIFDNGSEGIFDGGNNTLILHNRISNNDLAGDASIFISNTVIIGNSVNRGTGVGIVSIGSNAFVANNEIRGNTSSGVLVESNFADIQGNEVEKNQNNGIYVTSGTLSTFIFRNDVDDNKPHQIKDLGTNTTILQNKTHG